MSTDHLAGLIPFLRCPRCREGITTADEDHLQCANDHVWPVIEGIPRFTPPSSYADSFGYQWTTFRQTQLDNSIRTESEETFAVKTGLSPEDVKGKSVLDVGCGMGRFSDVVARWGAEAIVAMDLSRAVEAARENLAGYSGTHVIQGDASNPPIAPGSFDVVFSIGVLHHTPSTAKSLSAAAKLVKPGGIFAVWLYARKLRATHLGSEVLRPLTSRMKEDRLLKIVQVVVPRMDSLHERLPIVSKPLRVALPTSAHPDPEWRVLDTFDWYSPRYQWKHTDSEVMGWFRRLGFEDIRSLPVPVSVRGRRPA